MTICFPFSLYYSWDNSLRLKRLWAELQGPQEDNGLAGISTKILCEMIPKNIANPLSSRGSTILGCIRGWTWKIENLAIKPFLCILELFTTKRVQCMHIIKFIHEKQSFLEAWQILSFLSMCCIMSNCILLHFKMVWLKTFSTTRWLNPW